MKRATVGERLASLDTFDQWVTANDAQQTAFDAAPVDVNVNNLTDLTAQMEFLHARQEQRAARDTLMQEIAVQDSRFLPLTYRLGALAAFKATDVPPRVKHLGNGRMIGLSHDDLFRVDKSEQKIRPSRDPLLLAAQVGDELERIRKLLDSRTAVPVAMVWHNRFIPPRISYDEVVLGRISKPREAFVLEEPKVIETESVKAIEFTIPSNIKGVVKGKVISSDEYVQPEDKYKTPDITTLIALGVAHPETFSNIDALYIGAKDVNARVAKANDDNKAYKSKLENRRRMSFHERRY